MKQYVFLSISVRITDKNIAYNATIIANTFFYQFLTNFVTFGLFNDKS